MSYSLDETNKLKEAATVSVIADQELRKSNVTQFLADKGHEQAAESVRRLSSTLREVGLTDERDQPRIENLPNIAPKNLDRVANAALSVTEELSEKRVTETFRQNGRLNELAPIGRIDLTLQEKPLEFSTPGKLNPELVNLVQKPEGTRDTGDRLNDQISEARAEKNRPFLHDVASTSLAFLDAAHTMDLERVLKANARTQPSDTLRLEEIQNLKQSLKEAGYQVPEQGTNRPTPYADQEPRGSDRELMAIQKAAANVTAVMTDDSGKIVDIDLSKAPVDKKLASIALNSHFTDLSSSVENFQRQNAGREMDTDEILLRKMTPLVTALEIGNRIEATANLDTNDPHSVSYPYQMTPALKLSIKQMEQSDTKGLLHEAIHHHNTRDPDVSTAAIALSKTVGVDQLEDTANAIVSLSQMANGGRRRDDEAIVNRALAKEIGLKDDSKTVVPEEELRNFSKFNQIIVGDGTYAKLAELTGRSAKNLVAGNSQALDTYFQDLQGGTIREQNDKIFLSIEKDPERPQDSVRVRGRPVPLEMSAAEFGALSPEIQKASRAFVARPAALEIDGTSKRESRPEDRFFKDYEGPLATPNDTKAKRYATNRMTNHIAEKLAEEKANPPQGEPGKPREKTLRESLTGLSGVPIVAPSREEALAIRAVSNHLIDERKNEVARNMENLTKRKEVVSLTFDGDEFRQFAGEAGNAATPKPGVLVAREGGVFLEHPDREANSIKASSDKLGSLGDLKSGTKISLVPLEAIQEVARSDSKQISAEVVNQRLRSLEPEKEKPREKASVAER